MEQTEIAEKTDTALPQPTKLLLSISLLNALANNLSNIFINVFLFRLTDQIGTVVLFNLIMYISWVPAFIFAGWLSKKTSRRNGLISGGAAQLLFYFFILLFGDQASTYVIELGILFGAGSGFYWISVNVLSVDYTHEKNRDWFNGLNGTFESFSKMIGPLVSGWLIYIGDGFSGYYLVFGISFFLFIISFIISLTLSKDKDYAPFHWKDMLKVHRCRSWRLLSYAFMANAFRGGVISFIILIWVFMVTKNESALGNFSFMSTSLSFLIYYIMGRYGSSEHRLLYMLSGNILIGLALGGLLFEVSWELLLVYGILSGISIPLFEMPFNTLALNNISDFDKNGKNRVELVVAREIALSFGRITSVFLLYLIYLDDNNDIWMLRLFIISIIIIGLTPNFFLRSKDVEEGSCPQ
ncbi:MFS transporter [Salibacterium aidingense]|uniref:MFS transporter n=1 Tax=Salibacterium aidingense TaxID=384933 RepID=UPI003BC489A7